MGTINQNHSGSGDNVAGNKIVHITYEIPPTYFRSEVVKQAEKFVGGYLSETFLEVVAPFPIKNMYLEAQADNILSLDIIPQRTGSHQTGHSGKRAGYHFANVPNAHSLYLIKIVTSEREQVEIVIGGE